jgi:hypothetical protein
MVQGLAEILAHADVIGWVLLVIMIFFSSLAFKVLENAISVIFCTAWRSAGGTSWFRYCCRSATSYSSGTALFFATLGLAELIAIGEERLVILGHKWSLSGFSRVALYLAGVTGEILIISSIYYFHAGRADAADARADRRSNRRRALGNHRHALAWYFATISRVEVVYGPLTTAIVVLLSVEIAANAAAARRAGDRRIRAHRGGRRGQAAPGDEDRSGGEERLVPAAE